MSQKKSSQKQSKAGSEKQDDQTTATPKGRERTVARAAKAKPYASKGQPEEPPVELIIDGTGIHSLTAGTKPTEETPAAPKKAKSTKADAPQQPDDAEELVVFAFRLTRAERDAIHAAAGSAKASSFVRGLALAAARGDGDALQAIVTGIQTGR